MLKTPAGHDAALMTVLLHGFILTAKCRVKSPEWEVDDGWSR
jgi:hypothetical protein